MAYLEGEVIIHRPVEEVFDFVADERNELRYNSHLLSVEETTIGPIGVGTRFRAETTVMRRPYRRSSSSPSTSVRDGSLRNKPLEHGHQGRADV